MKKIAMGNDHSAVEMKEAIKAYVEQKGYEVIDFGTNSKLRLPGIRREGWTRGSIR